MHGSSRACPPRQRPASHACPPSQPHMPPTYAWQAGGTHPIGMLSCVFQFSVTKYAPTSHFGFLSKMYPHVLRELGPILSQVLIPEHVISSGYAGSKFGEQLLKGKANFTIIDQRNFMHDNIHATRSAVIPGRLQPLLETFSFTKLFFRESTEKLIVLVELK